MLSVQPCAFPEHALLDVYRANGAYTDCYVTDIADVVSHAQFVAAFYTTRVFKLERLILKWILSKPSIDAEAVQLAAGAIDTFAAWRVEKRAHNQLLMVDFQKRTRSWLMVDTLEAEGGPRTRLYFGSAVVPMKNAETGKSTMGRVFRALLGFHKLYSRILLSAARSRLEARGT